RWRCSVKRSMASSIRGRHGKVDRRPHRHPPKSRRQSNGENVLEARGPTQTEAWWRACEQARAVGMLVPPGNAEGRRAVSQRPLGERSRRTDAAGMRMAPQSARIGRLLVQEARQQSERNTTHLSAFLAGINSHSLRIGPSSGESRIPITRLFPAEATV